MLVKHVEVPQRVSEPKIMTPASTSQLIVSSSQSPYSRDCPQRPFESMISILRKLPWYKTDCITIQQRYSVYNACYQLIGLLQHSINEKKNQEHLTPQLLKRLSTSAMLCHGFTINQKDNIAYAAGIPENRMREFNMPRFPERWVHSYTLCPKPGTPLDMIEVCVLRFIAFGSLCCLRGRKRHTQREKVAELLTNLSTVVHCHHPRGDLAHRQPPAAQYSGSDPRGGKEDRPVLGLLFQGAEPPPWPGL